MTESSSERSALVKLLTLVGMLATVLFVVWLASRVFILLPSAFSSLASIAGEVNDYRPATELVLKTEKSIVNSKESFDIHWTDMRQTGAYHFSYACTEGVTLTTRDTSGKLTDVTCAEALTLPATIQSLSLNFTSLKARFTDVPLTLTFENKAKKIAFTEEIKMTVVNPSIPTQEETPRTDDAAKPDTGSDVPVVKPQTPAVSKPIPKPVTTTVYPSSNPNGFTDLKVTTLGSGVLTNGVFTYTPKYHSDVKSALRFDIKNIGTKTSDTWSFSINLPDGQKYTSETQTALKPNEHVEFTIGFGLGDEDTLAKMTTTVKTTSDTNSKNNTSEWSVVVTD